MNINITSFIDNSNSLLEYICKTLSVTFENIHYFRIYSCS